MKIEIKDIEEGKEIPAKFTCDSDDYSPEIRWSSIPAGTKSLMLIVDDPDAPAGNFVHWVIYNIPSSMDHLDENFPRKKLLPNGITQGRNDFGKIGYNGPCPPRGHGYHRYFFTLYALSIQKIDREELSKGELMNMVGNKIIDKNAMMGRYKR